jgi:hypothetical protein
MPNRARPKIWMSSLATMRRTAKQCIARWRSMVRPSMGSRQDFTDGSAFQVGQPPARVDILQQIDGISFDEAWSNRVEGLIDGDIAAAIISKADLIRNKLASGREQDVLDVKKLKEPAIGP